MTPGAVQAAPPILAAEDVLETASRIAGLDVATVVVAVVLAFLLALHRRWIVLGREVVAQEDDYETRRTETAAERARELETVERAHAREVAALEAAHARELAAVSETLSATRTDLELWRASAVRALDLGERAVASRDDER